jgi:hypothetical protein
MCRILTTSSFGGDVHVPFLRRKQIKRQHLEILSKTSMKIKKRNDGMGHECTGTHSILINSLKVIRIPLKCPTLSLGLVIL